MSLSPLQNHTRVNTLVNRESQFLTSASRLYHFTSTHKNIVSLENSSGKVKIPLLIGQMNIGKKEM